MLAAAAASYGCGVGPEGTGVGDVRDQPPQPAPAGSAQPARGQPLQPAAAPSSQSAADHPPAPAAAGWAEAAGPSDTSFRYPLEIGTEFITTVDWPPQLALEPGPFECAAAGSETARAGRTEPRTIDGRTYCVTRIVEGAAGSVYTLYAYAMPLGNDVAILTFSLRAPQCGNYDDPSRRECESERAEFSIDPLVDDIASTIRGSRQDPLRRQDAVDQAGSAETDGWLGRWNGPEGTWLEITGGDGVYEITVKNLDRAQTFRGTAVVDHIEFERDGRRETLRATDGEETGMKWLVGKSNCLTVRPGEGYCRD